MHKITNTPELLCSRVEVQRNLDCLQIRYPVLAVLEDKEAALYIKQEPATSISFDWAVENREAPRCAGGSKEVECVEASSLIIPQSD